MASRAQHRVEGHIGMLPGTLLLGLAIPFSLAVAALLPVLKTGWLSLVESTSPANSPVSWSTGLLLVLVSGVLSLWALAPNPSARIGVLSDARWSEVQTVADSRAALAQIRVELVETYGSDVDLAHLVKFAGLSTVDGSRSVSVVSDPHNFSISGHFVRQQCKELLKLAPDAVVLERETLKWLELEEACDGVLRNFWIQDTAAQGNWTVLVRKDLERRSA